MVVSRSSSNIRLDIVISWSNLKAATRAEHAQNNTCGTRAKRRRAEPVRNADARNPRVWWAVTTHWSRKKTHVRVSGTYGEMFTIPLVFHVLAYVPQCTSSMHLLFGVYGGVILAMVASRSCRLTSDKEGSAWFKFCCLPVPCVVVTKVTIVQGVEIIYQPALCRGAIKCSSVESRWYLATVPAIKI